MTSVKSYTNHCSVCKRSFPSRKSFTNHRRWCSGMMKNSKVVKKGRGSHAWKGGRRIQKGYISIYKPKHPRAAVNGMIGVHRLQAEKKLGRHLTNKEVVHHIDGDKLNNTLGNLWVFKNVKSHLNYEGNIVKTYIKWIKWYNQEC